MAMENVFGKVCENEQVAENVPVDENIVSKLLIWQYTMYSIQFELIIAETLQHKRNLVCCF